MKFISFVFVLFLSANFAFAADFITPDEYAKMLYNNPHGISCAKCHGEKGEEKILAYYMKDKDKIAFIVPDIRTLSFKIFKDSLNKKRELKSIMPNYSLTNDEIIALYNYILKANNKEIK